MSALWNDLRGELYFEAIEDYGIEIVAERPPGPLPVTALRPPSVKRNNVYRYVSATTRWTVWERDNFTCQLCGSRRFLVIDHRYPISRGGTNDIENLQTLCETCNTRKGAKVRP